MHACTHARMHSPRRRPPPRAPARPRTGRSKRWTDRLGRRSEESLYVYAEIRRKTARELPDALP